MTSAVYDVAYMGSDALSKSLSTSRLGLGVLQRPLLDLYSKYLPPPSSSKSPVIATRQLPQRRLTLTDRGLIISAIDALPSVRGDNDAFYAMPSIILWEAVRFVAVRAGKKYRGGFEPLGEHLGAVRDNLYIGLEKQNVHLVTKVTQHPVIFVCVLRRPTSAKHLDMHAFICGSPQEALDVTDNLHLLCSCYNEVNLGLLSGAGGGPHQQFVSASSATPSQFDDTPRRQARDDRLADQRQVEAYRDYHQQPTQRQQQQELQQQQRRSRGGQGSLQALSSSCFVLTQDDVRGDSLDGRSVKQRHRHAADDTDVRKSTPAVSSRSALVRSATSINPADTRHRALLPVFPAADNAAASTWLDEAQDDDRSIETRSLYENETDRRPAPLDDTRSLGDSEGFDFHFQLGAPSSSSQRQQQQPPQPAERSSRPVALVQPHKVTGVRVMPSELNASLLSWSQGRQTKQPPPAPVSAQPGPSRTTDASQQQPQRQQQQDVDRSKNKEERRPTPASSLRDQLKVASMPTSRDVNPTPVSSKQFDINGNTAPQSAPGQSASFSSPAAPTPARAFSDKTEATGAPLTSKDKEIASAIGDMRLDYDQSSQNTLSPHGTNFEKCLGYFP